MARILITGANGLLGSTLVPTLAARGHSVLSMSRHADKPFNVDITKMDRTLMALDVLQPQVIINLAAMTSVDECERCPESAYATNTLVVDNLVKWIAAGGNCCYLVQISTDQLYGGQGPHREDAICPLNYYAYSKYAAELIAGYVPSTVLRTNLFGRSRHPIRQSLTDWLVGVMRRCESAKVFDDVLFTPLSLETLSEMIGLVVERRIQGIFNLGSKDGMSKADFAYFLADMLGLQTQSLSRAKSTDIPLRARRPTDMRMDSSRFEREYGVTLPSLMSELLRVRHSYASNT